MRRFLVAATAFLSGCVGTDYISDPPASLEPRLVVSPDMAAIQVGQTRTFVVAFFDETGTRVDNTAPAWSVSDPNIATIDADGTLRALSQGQVHVVARLNDTLSDSVQVGVVDNSNQIAVIQISPGRLELEPGETAALQAVAINALGDTLETDYTWRSSDPAVASVTPDGQVMAEAAGVASITAAADNLTSPPSRIAVLGSERAGTFMPRPGSRYACEGSVALRPADAGGLEAAFGPDFIVSNGPRLEVFLSPTSEVGPGSVNIGPLKSTTGSQTYALPPDAELGTYNWVIIHCVPFNISFGWAQLQ